MIEAETPPLKPTTVARAVGISVAHASQILNERVTCSQKVAVKIFRQFGVKLGPLAGVSDDDIAALERIEAARA